ncbi:MAG: hypothetical protein ACLFUR_03975 [Candidatus Hadarchaeia archaeon]
MGLIALGALSLTAGIFGYSRVQELSSREEMLDQATKLSEEIDSMIISGDIGESRLVRIKVPNGHELKYEPEQKSFIFSGTKVPDNGFDYPIEASVLEFGPGDHSLFIEVEENGILIRELKE